MKPSGGFCPSRASLRMRVPEINSKSSWLKEKDDDMLEGRFNSLNEYNYLANNSQLIIILCWPVCSYLSYTFYFSLLTSKNLTFSLPKFDCVAAFFTLFLLHSVQEVVINLSSAYLFFYFHLIL